MGKKIKVTLAIVMIMAFCVPAFAGDGPNSVNKVARIVMSDEAVTVEAGGKVNIAMKCYNKYGKLVTDEAVIARYVRRTSEDTEVVKVGIDGTSIVVKGIEEGDTMITVFAKGKASHAVDIDVEVVSAE